MAGLYATFSQRVFWPRLQMAIWLDLPLPRLVWRVVARSWRRWRSKELLWGTNRIRLSSTKQVEQYAHAIEDALRNQES